MDRRSMGIQVWLDLDCHGGLDLLQGDALALLRWVLLADLHPRSLSLWHKLVEYLKLRRVYYVFTFLILVGWSRRNIF